MFILKYLTITGPVQASTSMGAWRSGMNQYQSPAFVQFLITQRDAAGNPVNSLSGRPLLALRAHLWMATSDPRPYVVR